MDQQNKDLDARLLEAIEQMRSDLARLASRVEQLEERLDGRSVQASGVPAPPDVATEPEIDAETMMSIAAALAAHLGMTPRIRAIRLLRSDAWAQQGRATLQAIHGNRRAKER